MTFCSASGCSSPAVSWLRFVGMGDMLHVHVCSRCEAIDREYADVLQGGVLPCPPELACGQAMFEARPPLLR